MINYKEQTEKLLEFDLVLNEVYRCFLSEYGIEFYKKSFIDKELKRSEIEKTYIYLSEYRFLKTQFPDFTIQHIFEFNFHLNKLDIENYVVPVEDLFRLGLLISNVRDIKSFFKETTNQNELEMLMDKAGILFYDTALLREIERVIDENGKVKSSASKELAQIRDRKKSIQSEIDNAFSRALNAARQSGHLHEIQETLRQNRRVLALQSAYKRSIKGIILDESDSGNVIYMEPAETIYLNNEASELEREEDREIRKVLLQLTAFLAKYKNLIFQYQEYMAEWDCIQALVRFMEKIDGSIPNIGDKFNLKNAFHPLLKIKSKKDHTSIVPFNLTFEEGYHLLVISGPNAGGKTVTLKTLGLLGLMARNAMPIPAEGNSVVPLFTDIIGDLGDLQSIEDELSTYSSKLRLWNHMMKYANQNSLILFDELGDGTDPSFGAAMAQSVLEKILSHKSIIIATTHYSDLKKFSESRKDTFSASMLFDETKLEPLFKLSVGFPGSSYTFHIARKMDLPTEVIKRAENLSESEKVQYDRQLFKLEKKEKDLYLQKKELEKSELELKKQLKDWNRLHLDMDLMRKKMRYEKTMLLQEQISEKERELKQFKDELKTKKKMEDLALEQSRISEEKKENSKASKELFKQIHQVDPNQKLSIGNRVQFIQTNAIGIIEKMNKDKVTVIFDNMKSTISASELILLPPEENKKKAVSKRLIAIDRSSSRELDIRGKFAYEGIAELDDFINRALLNNFHEIKIIHGKGKLRTEIINQLRQYKSVTKYEAALPENGGEGVTYVYF
jgi:DNA mismatch repair protein MutS2